MSKPVSDEELQLKVRARHRIIGACALVAILVLLLPMVLDSKPKRGTSEISTTIPAQEKAPPFNPPLKSPESIAEVTPVEKTAVEIADVKPIPPTSEPTNGVAKPAESELKPLNKPAEKPKAAEATKPVESKKPHEVAKPANTKPGKFAVQLGVFSKAENAQQLESRLSDNKIRHYREMLKSPPGAIRVRAGPYPSRKDAEAVVTQLKLAGITGGVVVGD